MGCCLLRPWLLVWLLLCIPCSSIVHTRGSPKSSLKEATDVSELVKASPSRPSANIDDSTLLFPHQLTTISDGDHALAKLRGTGHGQDSQKQMDKLINDKLSQYEKLSRPVPDCSTYDCSHRIRIRMSLSFKKIVSLDQKTGTLTMLVLTRITWPDYRLKYNASEYFRDVPIFGKGSNFDWNSATDFIPIDHDAVWLPDIQVLNAIDEPKVINHSPRVYWYDEEKLKMTGYNLVMETAQMVTTDCPMDLSLFPFDTQRCHLEFGDWTASKRFFEFDTSELGEYRWELPEKSREFKCVQVDVVRREEIFHVGETEHYPLVDYVLELKRLPHYYLLQFVLPQCILVLIGQGIYWMNLERERHSTAITVVLAVMTVSFLTASMLPETNEVMWLEKFQIGCYILTCLPVFTSMLFDNALSGGFISPHHIEHADALARVLHPLCVCLFYVNVLLFSGADWPGTQSDLVIFVAFNVVVYIVFAVSGIWNYFQFSASKQGTATEESQDQAKSTLPAHELRDAVDALRQALEKM